MCTLEFFPVHWINCTNQSGFYCLKLETCVYNKSNKSGDLHLKIAQPPKNRRQGTKCVPGAMIASSLSAKVKIQ